MTSKKQRVAGLLKRFQFIDLSRAVTAQGENRRTFLRDYAFGGAPPSSYEAFRKCIGGLYGVRRGLDISPRPTAEEALAAVRRACKGKNEDMNLSAAESLQSLLKDASFEAYEHGLPESLKLGTDNKCFFRLGHYLVRGDKAVFQFPYPRRTRLSERELQIMLSLIHYAFVKNDFEGAEVEIADLSCEAGSFRVDGVRVRAPRSPRIVRLVDGAAIDRAELQEQIDDVYRILIELGDET